MITLLWKELRENLKWALLAMIALGGAELFALYQTQNGQPEYYNYSAGITLCKPSFLIVTTFGPAAIGFLLGLVQILPELKADRWAALLHRPVSRSVIFWGKAGAGLLLYVIAAVPPFLLCVWLAATPGHFSAPFVPGLVLPGTADTCAGLVYYFAALAVALQRGGWVALRGLPLLAAVHTSFFVVATVAFGDAVAAATLMSATLGAAAWGAMHHQWSFGARPWLGRWAFFAAAFYGICGLGDVVTFVFNTADADSGTYTDYELSREGLPLKLGYVEGVVASVQNLDGSVPTNPDYKPDRIRNHLQYPNGVSSYIGDPHGWKRTRFTRPYRDTNAHLWVMTLFQHPRMEQWFYLVESRTLIGMLPNKKIPTARLDAHGFEPAAAEPVPFPPEATINSMGQGSVCLAEGKSVRFVNLARRKITEATLPITSTVFGLGSAWAYRDDRGSVQVMAVALSSAVAVYDSKEGSLLATLPYRHDMDRWGDLRVGLNATMDRFYLWYTPSVWIPRKEAREMPSYLDEVNLQGQVLRSDILPPLSDPPRHRSWLQYVSQQVQSPAFFLGNMIYQKAGAALGNTRLKNALTLELGENWNRTKETAIHITVLSFLLAVVTLWWARRSHFSRRRAWSWAAIALVFNLAGFLVFRLLADWPRLVACAACRQRRPVDQEKCPRCGDGWPEFPPNGTEIFDHQTERAGTSALPA